MNKIDKGLQGYATYQKSKLYPFKFQRTRILKLVFFVPMFQLVTPRVGPILTLGSLKEQLGRGPLEDGVGSVLTQKESYE